MTFETCLITSFVRITLLIVCCSDFILNGKPAGKFWKSSLILTMPLQNTSKRIFRFYISSFSENIKKSYVFESSCSTRIGLLYWLFRMLNTIWSCKLEPSLCRESNSFAQSIGGETSSIKFMVTSKFNSAKLTLS